MLAMLLIVTSAFAHPTADVHLHGIDWAEWGLLGAWGVAALGWGVWAQRAGRKAADASSLPRSVAMGLLACLSFRGEGLEGAPVDIPEGSGTRVDTVRLTGLDAERLLEWTGSGSGADLASTVAATQALGRAILSVHASDLAIATTEPGVLVVSLDDHDVSVVVDHVGGHTVTAVTVRPVVG